MAWVHKLGRAERIVVIIAFGVALDAFLSYFVPIGGSGPISFSFSTSSSAPLTLVRGGGLSGWLRVFVWIVCALTWAAVSIRILRAPRPDSD